MVAGFLWFDLVQDSLNFENEMPGMLILDSIFQTLGLVAGPAGR
jgi:hypothetical protein